MAKKKRCIGHYCKVCNCIVANERFSGKGHSSHICKKCSKLSLEERNEQIDLNRIYELYSYSNLSKVNKLLLQNYLRSGSEKVRLASKEMLDGVYNKSIQIKMDEEYEDMMGIDIGNDEYLDDDDYIEDLYRIDGSLDLNSAVDDELPF